jgi:hypothetical protein
LARFPFGFTPEQIGDMTPHQHYILLTESSEPVTGMKSFKTETDYLEWLSKR